MKQCYVPKADFKIDDQFGASTIWIICDKQQNGLLTIQSKETYQAKAI